MAKRRPSVGCTRARAHWNGPAAPRSTAVSTANPRRPLSRIAPNHRHRAGVIAAGVRLASRANPRWDVSSGARAHCSSPAAGPAFASRWSVERDGRALAQPPAIDVGARSSLSVAIAARLLSPRRPHARTCSMLPLGQVLLSSVAATSAVGRGMSLPQLIRRRRRVASVAVCGQTAWRDLPHPTACARAHRCWPAARCCTAASIVTHAAAVPELTR